MLTRRIAAPAPFLVKFDGSPLICEDADAKFDWRGLLRAAQRADEMADKAALLRAAQVAVAPDAGCPLDTYMRSAFAQHDLIFREQHAIFRAHKSDTVLGKRQRSGGDDDGGGGGAEQHNEHRDGEASSGAHGALARMASHLRTLSTIAAASALICAVRQRRTARERQQLADGSGGGDVRGGGDQRVRLPAPQAELPREQRLVGMIERELRPERLGAFELRLLGAVDENTGCQVANVADGGGSSGGGDGDEEEEEDDTAEGGACQQFRAGLIPALAAALWQIGSPSRAPTRALPQLSASMRMLCGARLVITIVYTGSAAQGALRLRRLACICHAPGRGAWVQTVDLRPAVLLPRSAESASKVEVGVKLAPAPASAPHACAGERLAGQAPAVHGWLFYEGEHGECHSSALVDGQQPFFSAEPPRYVPAVEDDIGAAAPSVAHCGSALLQGLAVVDAVLAGGSSDAGSGSEDEGGGE